MDTKMSIQTCGVSRTRIDLVDARANPSRQIRGQGIKMV